MKTLGRSISRSNRAAIARQCLKDSGIRAKIFLYLEKDVQQELTGMCSKKVASVFRASSAEHLHVFSWDQVSEELKCRAPTLHALLSMCVNVKRRVRPSKNSGSVPCSHKPSNSTVLGVCASILLRHRNQCMNTLQRLVSLVLHRGHAGKQVISVCWKMCVQNNRHVIYKLLHIYRSTGGYNHSSCVCLVSRRMS